MILLDERADTLPVGLSGTPFETVYKAIRSVAASVWSVDPTAYRAGMAWGFYAQHDPQALERFRAVVAAALVSAQAPLVKEMQTVAELVEYLRLWREYLPTFPALSAIFRLFGAVVDVLPVTDAESQAILPAPDRRGAFYLRIEVGDMQRLLTLDEAVRLALNATPLGSRPLAYLSLESSIPAGVAVCSDAVTIFVENDAICEATATAKTLICGVLTETSDEVVEVETPYQLENGIISFTGELRDNVIPESGVVKEYSYIKVLSGVLYSNGNFATRFITTYYENLLMPTTQADADAITNYGLTLKNVGTYGPYGAVLWDDNYTFEPVAVYTDIDGTNEYTDVDVSGLYCHADWSAANSVSMRSRNTYFGSQVMTWRCRITKK